ncbi:hypothetical protein J2S05_001870 [Alkalicoccobacillus murimartini]|uniref:NERD domain-containing protein n=2 Tax=Alkalicoccobacillus murimartini TaxID=171685 RepID=A0ABT9YH98_9BACI|nr:hypothetical protein [Alkalicoccobacillus murimartini]
MDYHFQFLNDDFTLLHDLRIRGINQTFFQMDTVVLCPQFIGIIEVKNLSGSIIFDESTKQMLRKTQNGVESLPNPLTQVRRQRIQLENFLTDQGFPGLPVKSIVVFAHPSTIIETENKSIIHSVIRAEFISEKLELLQGNPIKTHLTFNQIQSIAKQLCQADSPDLTSIFQTYEIDRSDIRKGVYCPSCSHPLMSRQQKNGSWYCSRCLNYSKTAHLQALDDFSILFDEPLTNRACRDFLQLQSRHTTYRMLKERNQMQGNG